MDVVAVCRYSCADRSRAPLDGEVHRAIDASGCSRQLCTLDLQVVTTLADSAEFGPVALGEPFSREVQRTSISTITIGVGASRVTALPVGAVGPIDLDAAGIERSRHILPALRDNFSFLVNSSRGGIAVFVGQREIGPAVGDRSAHAINSLSAPLSQKSSRLRRARGELLGHRRINAALQIGLERGALGRTGWAWYLRFRRRAAPLPEPHPGRVGDQSGELGIGETLHVRD